VTGDADSFIDLGREQIRLRRHRFSQVL